MKYTNSKEEDALLQAIKNYPPGTEFISCIGSRLTVKGSCPMFYGGDGRITIEVVEQTNTSTFGGYGAVVRFSNGNWANIIEKAKLNYEIY